MKPLLQALVIADHVYEDQSTGKKIVAGIFHRMAITHKAPAVNPPGNTSGPRPEGREVAAAPVSTAQGTSRSVKSAEEPASDSPVAPKPPAAIPIDIRHLQRAGSPYAYISLTEVNGPTIVRLQCVDLLDNQVVFSTDLSVKGVNPLDTVELIAPLPPLPEVRGDHLGIELLCEGELLGMVRIAIDRRVLP